jgi:hypothetical protein
MSKRDLVLYVDDSDEPVALPHKWEICCRCNGEGTSSGYLGVFTAADMAEDPDFAEDYMNGQYDRACDECGGSGKVKVADFDRMKPEQAEAFQRQCRDDDEIDAIQRSERLMEGGWRELGWYGN